MRACMLRLLINLERSHERLSWMQEEFGRLGLDFQRIGAIDGTSLSEKDIQNATHQRRDGLRWPRSEVACFLSHRECWKVAARATVSHIAIFEDDIHLAPISARFLTDASWIPNGIDVVKLETYFHETRLSQKAIRRGDCSLFQIRAKHLGAAGYIIARSVANRLLELTSRFDRQVDEVLFDPDGPGSSLSCYQINPAICIQDPILNQDAHLIPSVINEDRKMVYDMPGSPGIALPAAKYKGINKLKREVARPFKQLRKKIKGLIRLILYREKTLEVPYARRGNTSQHIRRLNASGPQRIRWYRWLGSNQRPPDPQSDLSHCDIRLFDVHVAPMSHPGVCSQPDYRANDR
ncbi:glycosyltransferase family 25 protein [Mesorhizobium quangtriensis]|uniref:glycosyltransferase family 25 protein n=1 Tax=Mesorhizobium quangtriensis TaxID=3157709 RepID=UPI003CCDD398